MSANDIEETITPEGENKDATTDSTVPTQDSWTLKFIGYGALAGLPIPIIGWLWLILSVHSAIKLGWVKGAIGIGIFWGTAIVTRIVLGLLLSAFLGN